MGRRKTNEKFLMELKEHNKNIEALEEYNGTHNKIKFKCKNCGSEFYETPHNMLEYTIGCRKCSYVIRTNKKRKTDEQFKEEVKEINHNIEQLEDYIDAKTKIKFRCKICDHTWYAMPRSIINNKTGCPKCSTKKATVLQTKTNIKFINELSKINNDIEALDEYINRKTDILFRCKICNHTWYATPGNVLRGTSCPKCASGRNKSKLEDELYNTLKNKINGKYNIIQSQIIKNKKGRYYQLDIFIPELKLGIEFDGLYWHSLDKIGKNYSLNKLKFFNELGINVIFIREDEWVNKKELVLDRILSKLSLELKSIYARKLNIKIVRNHIKNIFLDRYHIQGKDKSRISYGLYTKDNKIVALITLQKSGRFGNKSTFDKDNNTYEIVRYASRTGYYVVGGFSKLVKYSEKILKNYGVKYLKTFADMRYSSGNLYEKCEFKLKHISPPNYIYFKNYHILTRYQCQKHKLKELLGEENFNNNLSEYENMVNNGWRKYEDCGNLVYYKEIK